MPPTAPAATEIPRWPKITATLSTDGSGTLTIDGRSQKLAAADISAARTDVLHQVSATAETIGRPVRLNTTDPDGEWELAVHPDGRVAEIAATPAVDTTVARATAPPRRSSDKSVARATPPDEPDTDAVEIVPLPPGRRVALARRRRPSRRTTGRIGAGVALLVLGVAIAFVLTSGPDTVVHAPSTTVAARVATTPAPGLAAAAIAEAKQRAVQRKAARVAAAKKLRQRAALRHRVAVRHARERRVAARRRAAAARATAVAAPPPAAPARPPARVTPPPPPPPAKPPCGEFDLC